MRVLMLSWEYPPVAIGGLARHVHALATHLVRQGHEVVVLCRHAAGTDAGTHPRTDRVVEGVRIVRVAEDPMHVTFERDLVAWTLAMGHAMIRAAQDLLRTWQPDVVHAHDWLVAHPAIAIAEAARVPLVGTIHATEAGRHSGWLSHPLNQQVHSVEWWLANRADALITCSQAMRREVAYLFEVEAADVTVIHNGIEERGWQVPAKEIARAREVYSPAGAPLLLYFGRLEWEKGVQDLLAALPGSGVVTPGRAWSLPEKDDTSTSWSNSRGSCGCGARSTSSGTSPTATCERRWRPPTLSCCPAGTSRSGSSRWRPRPRRRRWWPRPPVGSARSWCTARPGWRSVRAMSRN